MDAIKFLRGKLPDWITGYGNGNGYGNGYGDGYGYGYGYGYGDGNGDGYGYGYGYGDGAYWLACLQYFSAKWSEAQRARLAALQKLGAKICYWRSDKNGLPSNGGGRIDPAAPGVVHKSSGPLVTCNRGTLHATLIPPKWQGERMWAVALIGDVVGDDEKYGALEREIIGECL